MARSSDFLLKIIAADSDFYSRFQIEHLGLIKGVRNIQTDIWIQKNRCSWGSWSVSFVRRSPTSLGTQVRLHS
ncbi:hypothetical protein [Microvirga pakistanensis]|uniref:hypothetical protein n=1 Tax=Microvirga pakistanensis TaxID=1682650 RepID=UPI00106A7B73